MRIWVDADNCAGAVRQIIVKAVHRVSVPAVFVAGKPIRLPVSPLVSGIQVAAEEQAADRYIKSSAAEGDIVVTADIPLAYDLVAAGVSVVNPRGDIYTRDTVGERLYMRNFLSGLREMGLETPAPGKKKGKATSRFAGAFDRELTRLLNKTRARQG